MGFMADRNLHRKSQNPTRKTETTVFETKEVESRG